MNTKTGIVFLHGAGLGTFVWRDILPLIDFPVLDVEFPNRNQDAEKNTAINMTGYCQFAIQQIDAWRSDMKIVIVAHAIGGCIGLELSAYYKTLIIGFVGLSAAVPLPGNTFMSCLPFMQRILIPFMRRIFGTKPPHRIIERNVCNGLNDADRKMIIDNFTAEAKELFTERIAYKRLLFPTYYIMFKEDRSLSLAIQHTMAENLLAARTDIIPGGHVAMLSEGAGIAEKINAYIRFIDFLS